MTDELTVSSDKATVVVTPLPAGTTSWLRRRAQGLEHAFGFVKSRLGEKSSWICIGGAVAAASALPAPWSYFSLGCGIVAGMIPNDGHHHDDD